MVQSIGQSSAKINCAWKAAEQNLRNNNGGKKISNTDITNEMKRLATVNGCKDYNEFNKKFFSKQGSKYNLGNQASDTAAVSQNNTRTTGTALPKAEGAKPTAALTTPKELTEKPNIKLKNDNNPNATPLPRLTQNTNIADGNKEIDNNILNQAFNNVISKAQNGDKSVLKNTASAFVNAAKKHGVDPFALMGVSAFESGYGTSKMARMKNNVGGLTPNGRDGIHCASVSKSIDIAGKTLAKQVYTNHLKSIGEIGTYGNYIVASQDKRQNWSKGVTSIANKIKDEYNRLLSQRA